MEKTGEALFLKERTSPLGGGSGKGEKPGPALAEQDPVGFPGFLASPNL